MGAEFLENKALLDIIIKFCAKTSNFIVCHHNICETNVSEFILHIASNTE